MQGVEDGIYKAKPEHEHVTNEPAATAMAVMPNGEPVSNVYDAYEAGITSVMVEQEPVAWQFRTFHGEDTVCSGWDVWEDCTELKFNNVSEYVANGCYQVRKLYTSPTKCKPLTANQIDKIVNLQLK
jgi:hypothetical protein